MSIEDFKADRLAMLRMTTDIVSAYVTKNTFRSQDIPSLISTVYTGLLTATKAKFEAVEVTPVKAKFQVSAQQSVEHNHIICLEDGLRFKSLRRHLMQQHQMTPFQYRQKWNLPPDYPMLAPSYAERRARMAKEWRYGK